MMATLAFNNCLYFKHLIIALTLIEAVVLRCCSKSVFLENTNKFYKKTPVLKLQLVVLELDLVSLTGIMRAGWLVD